MSHQMPLKPESAIILQFHKKFQPITRDSLLMMHPLSILVITTTLCKKIVLKTELKILYERKICMWSKVKVFFLNHKAIINAVGTLKFNYLLLSISLKEVEVDAFETITKSRFLCYIVWKASQMLDEPLKIDNV